MVQRMNHIAQFDNCEEDYRVDAFISISQRHTHACKISINVAERPNEVPAECVCTTNYVVFLLFTLLLFIFQSFICPKQMEKTEDETDLKNTFNYIGDNAQMLSSHTSSVPIHMMETKYLVLACLVHRSVHFATCERTNKH